MPVPKLDIRATALENGYTEGQAETLCRWREKDVITFISNMTRADGKKPVLVWEGSYRTSP